ncbi:MAG: COX15/CtaA family protein [Dehalococcoidia bacterium]
MTRMLRLAILTSVATYLLIVVGAYVRVTGSGMGCPDWPRCYGELVPDLNVAVNRPMVIEVAHRYGASVVSLLVGALLVTALVAYRRNPAVLRPAVAAAALLMLQVILGGVTVLTGNAPWTVTAHLATSMALLAAAIITAVGAHVTAPRRARSSDRAASTVTEGFALLAAATTIAVYLLLLTGAIVRGEGAGLACKGWPLCNGAVFPAGDRLADIHSFHRLFTVATGVLVGVFVWQSVRRPRPPAIRAWAVIAGVLFAAQVMVGAVQVWSNLSQDTRLSHVAAGAAVWAALVVATALALVAARRARLARTPTAAPSRRRGRRPA